MCVQEERRLAQEFGEGALTVTLDKGRRKGRKRTIYLLLSKLRRSLGVFSVKRKDT